MTTQLKAIGGSLMALIPADIVREAGLKKGQVVEVSYADGKIVITTPAAKADWASYFARKIDPKVANYEFKRQEFEDREVFGSFTKEEEKAK
jgi:antitoxin component of MazEF toxin-antitoxin module